MSVAELDNLTKAWTDKYVADLNFKITCSDHTGTIPIFGYDPFIANPSNNPIKVTDISFVDTINQVGEFSLTINDTKDHMVDRDIIDNGMFVYIEGMRYGYPNTKEGMFFGYADEVVEQRRRGGIKEYIVNGLSSLGQTQNMLVNFTDSATRDNLSDTGFSTDRRFEAWSLVTQLFEDYQILPVTGGGKLNLRDRGLYFLDNISREVNQIIPIVDFPIVYASQVLAAIADMTGVDVYVDSNNKVQFHYPRYEKDITYLKDKYDDLIPPDEQDLAWSTSYITEPYVRHGSTRPSDGFANYLVGVAFTEGNIEVSSTEKEGFTSLVKRDLAQQFIAESGSFHYLAFAASKAGAGSEANDPANDSLRVKIVTDNNGLPTGSVVTQFFIRLKQIGPSVTIVAPAPSNQNTIVTPGAKYWIVWSRKGITEEDCIRIHHDNRLNTAPAVRSAVRLVSVDPVTGVQDPRVTDTKGGQWFFSTSGPTYAYAISAPQRKIVLDMADDLSIERWGQVDKKVDASWIQTPRLLGEYMSALMAYSSKKRWIYNFPQVTIPLRPLKAGRAISLRDEVLGITGVDEVDAYSIIQEVTYNVKASEYGLGTNTCSITSLGFQNPLDYTIGF
jgi:hypothetical protein